MIAISHALTTPGDGQWIGAGLICSEARYCLRLLLDRARIERLHLPLAAWREMEAEIGWGCKRDHCQREVSFPPRCGALHDGTVHPPELAARRRPSALEHHVGHSQLVQGDHSVRGEQQAEADLTRRRSAFEDADVPAGPAAGDARREATDAGADDQSTARQIPILEWAQAMPHSEPAGDSPCCSAPPRGTADDGPLNDITHRSPKPGGALFPDCGMAEPPLWTGGSERSRLGYTTVDVSSEPECQRGSRLRQVRHRGDLRDWRPRLWSRRACAATLVVDVFEWAGVQGFGRENRDAD